MLAQERASSGDGVGPRIQDPRHGEAGGKNRGADGTLVFAPLDYPSDQVGSDFCFSVKCFGRHYPRGQDYLRVTYHRHSYLNWRLAR